MLSACIFCLVAGAAIHAAVLNHDDEEGAYHHTQLRDLIIVDVTPLSLGVRTGKYRLTPIIELLFTFILLFEQAHKAL